MAIDDRSLLPSEEVSLSTPADASSSRWRRFRNWSTSQWAAIRPGPEARRGAVWGTLTAAAITVIIGGVRCDDNITREPVRFEPTTLQREIHKPRDDRRRGLQPGLGSRVPNGPRTALRVSAGGNSKVFDPSKLRMVRLKFDRTPMYKICISSIGFGKQ